MTIHVEGYYKHEPEENWNLREDVAGYEYPEAGYNYRIGVACKVMQTRADIDPLFDILNTPFNAYITRNMARAVLTKELLLHPPASLQSLLSTDLESAILLEDSGNSDLLDCCQVIFGRNHVSRQTVDAVVANELAAAERVFAEEKTKPFSLTFMERLKRVYSFEQITVGSDAGLFEEYSSLARTTFNYSPNDLDILEDEDTVLVAAISEHNKQRTVHGGAFGWYDKTYLKRDGRDVVLWSYETSGAVVRKEYRGKDLFKAIVVTLLTLLASRPCPIDVIFSFCNIEALPILAVAAQTGQHLVTDTARQLRLTVKPAIQQNIVEGRYVDDIVAYIPGEHLRRQFRAK